MNASDLLGDDDANYYQQQIGVLCCTVKRAGLN
jgi:hypothetical protein